MNCRPRPTGRPGFCCDGAQAVAQAAGDGRRVIGSTFKFGSAQQAHAAKVAAAKAKREAAAAAAKR